MNRRDALHSLLTLPAVGSVSVAQVRPEDIIVITAPVGVMLSDRSVAGIQEQAKIAFPGSKVLVMDSGLTLSIVRAQP